MLKIFKRTFPLEEEGRINRLNSEMDAEKRKSDQYEKALVETTESVIATAPHAIGEYITVNGMFCEVIDAICEGETINLDRNVKAANIGSVLSELKGE